MKYILLLIMFATFLSSCNLSDKRTPEVIDYESIEQLEFIYSKKAFEFDYPFPPLDYLPEELLSQEKKVWLVRHSMLDADTLSSFKEILTQSEYMGVDSPMSLFNTDIVAIVHIDSLHSDTLGISRDTAYTILKNGNLYKNHKILETVLQWIGERDPNIEAYIERASNGTYFNYYSRPDWGNIYFNDNFPPYYGIFECDSDLKELAIALCADDSIKVQQAIDANNKCINCSSYARITTSCILFQQPAMLNILLKNGENPSNRDYFHFDANALGVACRAPYFFESLKILVEFGANINEECGPGYTPLRECVMCRNFKAAVYLLNHHADMEVSDKNGLTAFDLAMNKRYYKMAYLFLLKGYKTDRVNTVDKEGRTQAISIGEYIHDHQALSSAGQKYAKMIIEFNKDANKNNQK